jgi:VanZ family protein
MISLRGKWRWLPAIVVMGLIFAFSSIPGRDLPSLGPLDFLAKKTAHALGYGILAVAFWYAQGWKPERRRVAWLLAVLYALTDELHQYFVPGRHSWLLDVAVFDAGGAFLGLWLAGMLRRRASQARNPEAHS